MAAADDISSAIDNLAAAIKEATVNPKPNYTVDGQSVSWGDYLQILTSRLDGLMKAKQSLAGPYQRMLRVVSR
jgi:hypothetical protein